MFDSRKGKKPCLGVNLGSFAANVGKNNVRTILDARNKKYDQHNLAAWGSKTTRELFFYNVAPANINLMMCRHPGCARNITPGPTASFQAFNKVWKCKGGELKEEKEKRGYQPVVHAA